MTFSALLVIDILIYCLPVLGIIVRAWFHSEVNNDVFEAVIGLGIEKFEGILRGWEMTVHAISYKSFGIVYMGRGLPGIIGVFDFMAGGTKFWCRCTNHGIVAHAKKRESQNGPQADENNILKST